RTSDGAILDTITVGNFPQSPLYDGANIWVGNYADGTLTKIRPSDDTILGTFNAGGPGNSTAHSAFDGANIWASGNAVTKLRASDGTTLGTFNLGTPIAGLVFDGTNTWAVAPTNQVLKLASDGTVAGTFDLDGLPNGSCNGTNNPCGCDNIE